MNLREKIAVVCCLWNAFRLDSDTAMYRIWALNDEENTRVWRLWQKSKTKRRSSKGKYEKAEREVLAALYEPYTSCRTREEAEK